MCGIVGFFDPHTPARETFTDRVERMSAELIHRGPDDSGCWIDAARGIALGHRRLSIIDLSPAGHQPMTSGCGRYVIVYNGEIYNFQELRTELEQGGVKAWRGHSDTEAMLAGFSRWGVEHTLPRLNGMFACAVYDREAETLYLFRDRLGKKPLYYGWHNGVFLFASELKALTVHPAFRFEVDRGALSLYTRYNYVPSPYSIYRGVFKLPPASLVKLTRDDLRTGALPAPVAYWNHAPASIRRAAGRFPGSEAAALARLDTLLKNAVKLRMISDVPLGVFLSGGIDSSLVTALMQSQSHSRVRSFSVGFSEPGYDEARFAQTVARQLGTDHTEFYVSPQDARDVIPALPRMFDEPFADSSQIPTFLVARLARRFVTVALSGDGGDELFGGYTRYPAALRLWNALRPVPRPLRSALSAFFLRRPPSFWRHPLLRRSLGTRSSLGDQILKLAGGMAARDGVSFYESFFLTHWRPNPPLVLGAKALPLLFEMKNISAGSGPFLEALMHFDAVSYLPDDILVKTDRTSMAVSLETRSPLLDYRVYEFAASLPSALKLRGRNGKWILKELLSRYLPRDLFERPKRGFSVPLAAWLRGPLCDWAEGLLAEARLKREGYFNPAPVRAAWREHLTGKRNLSHALWVILMFQSWLESRCSSAPVRETVHG